MEGCTLPLRPAWSFFCSWEMRYLVTGWESNPEHPAYCAVPKIGDSPSRTAQSGGEFEEGRRSAPRGRVPATQAWVRGEG